jgi:hypothetical protein
MAGELRANVVTTVRGDATNKLSKDLEGLTGRIKSVGSAAAGAAKGFAGLVATFATSKFVEGTITEAKNLERAMLGLDTVFGDLAPRMEQFSQNATQFGLSTSEAANASVFLGSVLQQYGISGNAAAAQTEKLTSLAADLAVTYGYDVQEALTAVTALFRGEYDPIEKFGVAMKQNEINAEKAARGLDKLTGAAGMQADAQIRLELLYERSAKAQGAFERGADTLVVQQEKLRATFANMQADLGAALIPAIADLFSELQPLIEEATPGLVAIFEVLGEVMMFLVDVFTDFFDHTTQIGDSVIELGATFQFLVEEIGGVQITLQDVFDFIRDGIDFVIEGFSLLLVVIHNAVIVVKVLGQMFDALINQDWDRLFNTNWYGLIENTIAAADAARDARIEFARLAAAARASLDPKNLGDQTEIWDALAAGAGTAGTDAGNSFKKNFNKGAAKTGKDFWERLTEEIEKQQSRMRLRDMGLSEALVESILGDAEWEKVFDRIIKGGKRAADELQRMFNQTAAGIRELEQIQADQNQRMADQAAQREAMIQGIVQRSFDASMEQFEKFRELLKDFTTTAVSAFGAFRELLFPEAELGRFEGGVVSLERSLLDLLETQKELFSEENRRTLQNYVTETAATMRAIGFARDELNKQLAEEQAKLEQQVSGRKSMF